MCMGLLRGDDAILRGEIFRHLFKVDNNIHKRRDTYISLLVPTNSCNKATRHHSQTRNVGLIGQTRSNIYTKFGKQP